MLNNNLIADNELFSVSLDTTHLLTLGSTQILPNNIDNNKACYTVEGDIELNSYALEEDYVELRDGSSVIKTANCDLFIFDPPTGSDYHKGLINFTDLRYGHTTEVILDPEMITYGAFYNLQETSISGYFVFLFPLGICLSFMVIYVIKIRKRIKFVNK